MAELVASSLIGNKHLGEILSQFWFSGAFDVRNTLYSAVFKFVKDSDAEDAIL